MAGKHEKFKLETDLNTLRALVAVVEEGSFSAAAKRMHRTQSAVSVQIAKLEEQLETKLLARTSRSLKLTPTGESVLSYAQRILDLSAEIGTVVNLNVEKDLLRVGIADYLAPRHLETLVPRFKSEHEHCELSLVFGLGGPLLEQLEKGDLDLVVAGPEGEGGTVLWEEPLVWTGALTSDRPDEPLDLVLMPPPCAYRKVVFDSLTRITRPWKLAFEAGSIDSVQAIIRRGLGLTVLPLPAVEEGMPILEGVLPDLPKTTVEKYTRSGTEHAYVKAFLEILAPGIR